MSDSSAPHEPFTARAAALAATLSILVGAPFVTRWPDDWDSVGFVLSAQKIDVLAGSPHPPGYPLYALLCRALGSVFVAHSALPSFALSLASLVSVALVAALIATQLPPTRGPATRALLATLAWSSCAGLLRLSGAIRPDLLALAALCFACFFAHRNRPWLVSLCVGIALSLRLSELPLVLIVGAVFACRTPHARSLRWVCALVGALALALGSHALLAAATGPRAYVSALVAHAVGHNTVWGDTAWIANDFPSRFSAFLQGITGFFAEQRGGALGLLLLGSVLCRALFGAPSFARMAGSVRVATAGLVTWSLWIFVMQPPRVERHLAPLAIAVAVATADGLARTRKPWIFRAITTLLALTTVANWVALAPVRARPVAGMSAARFAQQHDAMLIGGRSARFAAVLGVPFAHATTLADAEQTLVRLHRLPPVVLITSEVQHRAQAHGTLTWATTLCGPRSPRGDPSCLALYRWRP
ncbi:MAG: hypothetical protein Q8Q09_11585 [Deltaproteobacteria bacterium]|nr:hypothetical protein [Deltaproteobacteria bacterium]